jgi:DNA-directed RNA polymerase specialized sigma24 family protein
LGNEKLKMKNEKRLYIYFTFFTFTLMKYSKYIHNFSTESLLFWKSWKGRLVPSFYPYLLTPGVINELQKISFGIMKPYTLTQNERQDLSSELLLILLQQAKKLCENYQYIHSSIFSLLFIYIQKAGKKNIFQLNRSKVKLKESTNIKKELLLEDKVMEKMTFENLYRAIRNLPSLEREIIESVYFKNISLSQKAREIKHSVSYVYKKKQKALARLKDALVLAG